MKKKRLIKVGDVFGCLTIREEAGDVEFATDVRKAFIVRCFCGLEYKRVNRYITRKMNLFCSPECGLRKKQ